MASVYFGRHCKRLEFPKRAINDQSGRIHHSYFILRLMSRRAFTLIELLVVISIIGLLSTIAIVATGSAQKNSRNAKRKADLIQISKALELYYSYNNAYPSTGSTFLGNCSAYQGRPDTDPNSWIPGLVSGGFMSKLPHDPRSGVANNNSPSVSCKTMPNNSCYLYISDGQNYVLLAYCTPEGSWTSSDPFYSSVGGGAASNMEWRIASAPNAITDGWY